MRSCNRRTATLVSLVVVSLLCASCGKEGDAAIDTQIDTLTDTVSDAAEGVVDGCGQAINTERRAFDLGAQRYSGCRYRA